MYTDYQGHIHVDWDNGISLSLIRYEDQFKKLINYYRRNEESRLKRLTLAE